MQDNNYIWDIKKIESLTENEAKAMAEETLTIKEHTVYLIDFHGYFGLSRVVFCNGHHIHYANDYELHHPNKERAQLRECLINGANNILFTEEELAEPLKDYDEYTRKEYFLRNYYSMREDYISCFGNFSDPTFEKSWKRKTASMIHDDISFAYYAKDKQEFVKHHYELFVTLQKSKAETVNDPEYQKKAFLREMFNHEYGINWEADYDTLSAFGNLVYHRQDDGLELQDYFDQLKFSELQRKAYFEARREYYEMFNAMT